MSELQPASSPAATLNVSVLFRLRFQRSSLVCAQRSSTTPEVRPLTTGGFYGGFAWWSQR